MAEAPAPAGGGFDVRRLLLLGGVVLVISIAGLFIVFRGCAAASKSGGGHTVIYSNMDLRDAANVVARLKELKIPYEIRDQGLAIAVPKNYSSQARLGLAEKNLPAGGVVGWEIFDEAKLGATDFDRRIQLIRAISGELSRTIRRIQAIEDVRVQIVLPETRLFAATTAPVTASVLLRLRPGDELDSEKINGIVHLVASSVENLQPENVTVVDNTGKILTSKEVLSTRKATLPIKEVEIPKEESPQPKLAVTPEVTTSVEVTSPEAIAPIAAPPTPEERILLKVRAKKELEEDLAGKAQEILNRFYPPNSVIVKVNTDLKTLPNTRKYKINDLKVKKINAIILVDNRVDLSKKLKQSTYKAVAAAVGYNRKRGDRILLQKVPFHLATPAPEVVKGEVQKILPPPPKPEKKSSFPSGIFWLLGSGILGLAFYFGSRLLKKPSTKLEPAGVPTPETETAPQPKRTSMMDNVKSMAERNPERIAELLRNWLTEKNAP